MTRRELLAGAGAKRIRFVESAPSENDPGYGKPRIVVDVISVRTIDLAIIDGITSMAGGENPWVKNNLRYDTLLLSDAPGLGSADLKNIEVTGTSIEKGALSL